MLRVSYFQRLCFSFAGSCCFLMQVGCSSKKAEEQLILKTDTELAELFPESFRPDDLAWASPNVCAECHTTSHDDWLKSHHAIANRLIDPETDAAAFSVSYVKDEAGFEYDLSAEGDALTIAQKDAPSTMPEGHDSPVIGVIGETPIRQYLVPTSKGRLQTQALTWDPDKEEWFNVFGDEDRRPTEWGHWSQQGMNWNTNCAFCHMTDYEKNYDMHENEYKSTWLMQTVSCVQCHSGMEEHVKTARSGEYVAPVTPANLQISMENCATCHARREELTANGFHAGERFFDHYRLTLPDTPGAYFPDGQALEEDYVYASFMMSRMGHKGITCMDCHNPHSGDPILPVQNNALCMRCHSTGANESIVIDPLIHSHHKEGSAGNSCIECHMPERVYMGRDSRRDHGFTSPDPQLTIDFGVPNTCNTCHADQTTEWANEHVNSWYGDTQRRNHVQNRAKTLTDAHQGLPDSLAAVKLILAAEENVYWKTAWMRLLSVNAQDDSVVEIAEENFKHESPMLREASLTVLSQRQEQLENLQLALKDEALLVRNRAAEALMSQFDPGMEAFQEWEDYAEMNADRPGGSLRRAELALVQGDFPLAKKLTLQAVSFDKENPYLYYDAAILLSRAGDVRGALSILAEARKIGPEIALLAYSEGLLLAENGDYSGAEKAFVQAVGLDPNQARWWYNLAMIYAYMSEPQKAMGCISRAIELEPSNTDFLIYQQQLGAQLQRQAPPQ
jgi:predicted CXXCH cytochrome family protein